MVVVTKLHNLEAVATKQFTVEIKPNQILSLLRLQRVRNYTEEKTREQAGEQAEKVWIILNDLLPQNGRIALVEPIRMGLTFAKTIERLSNQLNSRKPLDMTNLQQTEKATRVDLAVRIFRL